MKDLNYAVWAQRDDGVWRRVTVVPRPYDYCESLIRILRRKIPYVIGLWSDAPTLDVITPALEHVALEES